MALSTLKNRETYTSTANQTSFPFTVSGVPVPFFALTDIKVFVQIPTATTETELTYNASPSDNTQFSITATNNDTQQGGTITLGGTGYVVNTLVSIERSVPLSQEYDLQEGSAIDPTALNTALDRTVAQSQQIADDQSITFPKTDLTSITYNVSESATSRANKLIGFDNNGNINTQSFSSVAGSALTAGNGIEISSGNIRVDNSTDFTFSGSGELQLATDSVDSAEIKANAVDTAEIADSAVTEAKIGNNAVTASKIAGNAVGSAQISDGAVTSSELAGNAVSLPTMAQIAKGSVIGRTSAGTGNPEHVPVGNFEEFYLFNAGTTDLEKTSSGTFTYNFTDFTSATSGFDNTKIKSILIIFRGHSSGTGNSGYIEFEAKDSSSTVMALGRICQVVSQSGSQDRDINTVNIPFPSNVDNFVITISESGASMTSKIIGATTVG